MPFGPGNQQHQDLAMQPNNGEPMAIFSPGVLDSSSYGAWCGGFGAAPIEFPEVVLKRGKRNSRKLWKDAIPMGIEESIDAEVWKDNESMKILESSKDKNRKEKRKESHNYISSDEERKDGRRRRRKDIDTAVPWTEEMVKYLFETYDDVHRRLYIESRGKVKNQKKWDPIIKTMQEKFGRVFTKNQCESKYWKVRRECAKYKIKLEKRAQHEKDAYPSKAVRELLKPKLYDVWLEVAGGKSARMPEIEGSSGSEDDMAPEFGTTIPGNDDDLIGDGNEENGEASQHHHSASCAIVHEMQQLITRRVEASEKREEALNIRAELTMELLRQHMERIERTGHTGDDARQRQLQMIEGVDNKLDRLVSGLGVLNTNIGAIIGRLTPIQR